VAAAGDTFVDAVKLVLILRVEQETHRPRALPVLANEVADGAHPVVALQPGDGGVAILGVERLGEVSEGVVAQGPSGPLQHADAVQVAGSLAPGAGDHVILVTALVLVLRGVGGGEVQHCVRTRKTIGLLLNLLGDALGGLGLRFGAASWWGGGGGGGGRGGGGGGERGVRRPG